MTTRNGLDLGLQYRNGVALPDSAALAGTVVVVDSTGTNLAFTGVPLAGLGDFADGTVNNEYLGWNAATSKWAPTGSVPFASATQTEYPFTNGSKLTTTASGATLVFDPASGTVSRIGTIAGASAADAIVIQPGGVTSSGVGANISIGAGATNSGSAGQANVSGGTSSYGAGGAATLVGGTGTTEGGNAYVLGGLCSTTGAGGSVYVSAGAGNAAVAGTVTIHGGDNTGGLGGNVIITGGDATGSASGVGGDITIAGGSGNAASGYVGGWVTLSAGIGREVMLANASGGIGLRVGGSGAVPTLGFFGKSPIAQLASYAQSDPRTEIRAIRAELVRLGILPTVSGTQIDTTLQGTATTVAATPGAAVALRLTGTTTTIPVVTGTCRYGVTVVFYDSTNALVSDEFVFIVRSTGTNLHCISRPGSGSSGVPAASPTQSHSGNGEYEIAIATGAIGITMSRDTAARTAIVTIDTKVIV